MDGHTRRQCVEPEPADPLRKSNVFENKLGPFLVIFAPRLVCLIHLRVVQLEGTGCCDHCLPACEPQISPNVLAHLRLGDFPKRLRARFALD